MTESSKPETIDAYIAQFPDSVQVKLQAIRAVIRDHAPDAQEAMRYQMPTFQLEGNLIHFAAYKHHIGIYPTPTGVEAFKEELSGYKNAKGSIQIPLDQPLPLELIGKITAYRVQENLSKRKVKKQIKKAK